MSRFHDALRKAEQSGSSAAGLTNHGVFPEVSPVQDAFGPGYVQSSEVPSGFGGTRPSTDEMSFELIEARCSKGAWSPDPQRILFLGQNENCLEHEQFRTLRSRLCQARAERPIKSVMIASALPGEGKTFVAANLALAMVRQGRRALLVDADLRHSELHDVLGVSPAPGLAEYLGGKAGELSIVRKDPSSNLCFVPAGESVPNPGELIGNGKLQKLMETMQSVFDWIIVDSPPTARVADAALVAQACDSIALVLRANSTPLDIAQKMLDEFHGKLVLGVILNQAVMQSPYGSDYHEAYGRNGTSAPVKD